MRLLTFRRPEDGVATLGVRLGQRVLEVCSRRCRVAEALEHEA
jgi:hypothetical protein